MIRGPFNDTAIQELQRRGIAASTTAADKGMTSPMSNLAETLVAYKHNAKFDEVIYIHDDAILNHSEVFSDSFRPDAILGSKYSKLFDFLRPTTTCDWSRMQAPLHCDGCQ